MSFLSEHVKQELPTCICLHIVASLACMGSSSLSTIHVADPGRRPGFRLPIFSATRTECLWYLQHTSSKHTPTQNSAAAAIASLQYSDFADFFRRLYAKAHEMRMQMPRRSDLQRTMTSAIICSLICNETEGLLFRYSTFGTRCTHGCMHTPTRAQCRSVRSARDA